MRRKGFTPCGYKIWSRSEEAYVKRHYPDLERIQRCVPHRTSRAIQAKAFKLGVTRKCKPWTAAKVLLLRKLWVRGSRDDISRAFPEYSWGRLRAKASSLRLRRPSQQLPAIHPLIEEIRARGRKLDLTLTDIDHLTKNRSYFTSSRLKTNPHIEPLLRAIEALDGHIEIVWR
ncbi:MAG: hypothetical protein J0G36_22075 [Afipia sp.]|nr:hypothetical protein [Afipia sp.]